MYAVPPTRTTDANALPMAVVCWPERSEESCTTLPVVEPEKNCTVILTEPALRHAVSDRLSVWRTDPDQPATTDPEASGVTARLRSRQATTVISFRAAF